MVVLVGIVQVSIGFQDWPNTYHVRVAMELAWVQIEHCKGSRERITRSRIKLHFPNVYTIAPGYR